ncbi:hypothetical protein PMV_398 [Port-miou virus]|uniref:Uncharacterized protein n=1 Tax=Port-miou virus TaxID=1733873 RepID=A0A0N7G2G9_9VIRU|nr:hypothetical protein PMV_398 [Port-miou virus]
MDQFLDLHFPVSNLKRISWVDVSWGDVRILREECERLEKLDLDGLTHFSPLSFSDTNFPIKDFELWKCKIFGRWFWISDRKEKHRRRQQREEWLRKDRF